MEEKIQRFLLGEPFFSCESERVDAEEVAIFCGPHMSFQIRDDSWRPGAALFEQLEAFRQERFVHLHQTNVAIFLLTGKQIRVNWTAASSGRFATREIPGRQLRRSVKSQAERR